MIGTELVLALWFVIVGTGVTELIGLRRRPGLTRALFSPVIGLVSSGAVAAVLTGLGAPRPVSGVVIAGAILVIAACVGALRRVQLPALIKTGLLSLSAVLAIVGVLYVSLGPILTPDSYRFVIHGRSLRAERLALDGSGVSSYPVLVMHVQALARSVGGSYSVYAASAAACMAIVGSLEIAIRDAFTPRCHRRAWVIVMAFTIASFAGTYMLRVQLSYLNSHLLASALYVSALAAAWSVRDKQDRDGTVAMAGIMISGLCISRMEGLLIATLVVVFVASVAKLTRREVGLLAAFGFVPAVIWFGSLILNGASGDILSPSTASALLVMNGIALGIACAPTESALRSLAPQIGLTVLMSALALLLLIEPDTGHLSTETFLTNALITGGWGLLWWILLPLAVVLTVGNRRAESQPAWGLVLGGFVVVVICLGIVREFPYRGGWGDSGNRMLTHVVPAIFFYLVVSAGGACEQHIARRATPHSARQDSVEEAEETLSSPR